MDVTVDSVLELVPVFAIYLNCSDLSRSFGNSTRDALVLKFHRMRSTTTPTSTSKKGDPHFRCVPLSTGAEFRGKRGWTNIGPISTYSSPSSPPSAMARFFGEWNCFRRLDYREALCTFFLRAPLTSRLDPPAVLHQSPEIHTVDYPRSPRVFAKTPRRAFTPLSIAQTVRHVDASIRHVHASPPRRPKPMNAPTEREKPRQPIGNKAAFATKLANGSKYSAPIRADPASIFATPCGPQGHVAIDGSGMLMGADGELVTAARDEFRGPHRSRSPG